MAHLSEKIVVQTTDGRWSPQFKGVTTPSGNPCDKPSVRPPIDYADAPEVVIKNLPEVVVETSPEVYNETLPEFCDKSLPDLPSESKSARSSLSLISKPSKWRLTKKGGITAGVLTVLLVVSVVVGAVAATRRNSSPGESELSEAVNGSGMVVLNFGTTKSAIALFSQFDDGVIRKAQNLNGQWMSSDEIVAKDARNRTALTTAVWSIDGQDTWHVFYFDVDHILQQSIRSTDGTWARGSLGRQKFQASNSSSTGLSSCSSKFYGKPFDGTTRGLRIYFGNADHKVQELTWTEGDEEWSLGETFADSNGDGGVECTVAASSVTNVWLLTATNKLEQRWYQFNESVTAPNHPSKTWVPQLTYDNVLPNSAISAITAEENRLIHVQQPDHFVRQLFVTGGAQSGAWGTSLVVGSQPAVPGTKLAISFVPTTKTTHVFFQTNATTLTQFSRVDRDTNWVSDVVLTGADTHGFE
ncbi:MAG: hypothetical protein M1833_001656 [Piccolia ochrophora]|nr:MAG: hypothetical protein M1833_001656 [Piccolia ochrophora]